MVTRLRVSQIEKSFPGVKALDKIDFSVKAGSVHVLCGENGAGKSTLMKIINGIYQPDQGQIFIDDQPVSIHNPMDARKLGISMIFQEMNYVPELTIAENLCLGEWPTLPGGKIDWKKIKQQTCLLLEQEKLPYSPDTQLKDLTVSDIQMLEIIKAVSRNSRVIIMDEPTSAITNKEVDALFRKIRELKSRGVSIIYISHKLDEVFQIADEITVFRDGTVVDSKPASQLDIGTVIAMMVGRKMESNYPKETVELGDRMLEVCGVSGNGFQEVSFHARKGEIVGFAGLMGAGRTEVMRALFGLEPISSGEIKIRGKSVKIKKPQHSIQNGMVMLSEDRRRYGIIPVRSVRENCTISNLSKIIYGGRYHNKKEKELVTSYFGQMKVKTPTIETTIASLSGGNQQKVLLAKWMLCEPDILILDEPTRGIDVGAKYEIYRLITELVKEGKTVIMISSELPELIGMCDRIYVMCQGKLTGELKQEAFSQEKIMEYAIDAMEVKGGTQQ